MIGFDFELTAHQLLSEFCESMQDGQHLLVIYGVMALVVLQFTALKSNRVMILHQHCS